MGVCPALCAASTNETTSALRARWQSSLAGLIVPSVFEKCVKASTLARSSFASISERSSKPSSPVTGMNSSLAPMRLAKSCQGTRLL